MKDRVSDIAFFCLALAVGFLIFSETKSLPPSSAEMEIPQASQARLHPIRSSLPAEAGKTGAMVRLVEPPAASYGDPEWTEADRHFGRIVDTLPNAEYDPALGRAAREMAAQYAWIGGLVQNEAFMFILNASGAADWAVRQSFTLTTADGDDVIHKRLAQVLRYDENAPRPLRVGIGEALQVGNPPRRAIAILSSDSDLYLDPMPRVLRPGSRFPLRGSLPRGATKLKVLRMGPEGGITTLPSTLESDRFEVTIPAGLHRGVVWVELVANLSHGPTPLAQLGFYVGADLPSTWMGAPLPDESWVTTLSKAETYALALLNEDRSDAGVPHLSLDSELSDLARSHCEEMEREGYFGHTSPTHGSVGDRARQAGISVARLGENLARNKSLASAERGLLFSLGHRKNMLSKTFTRVGIGIAWADHAGGKDWYLCQVFASGP